MDKLVFRIDHGPVRLLGPGKIDLLEAIGRCGSISRAARDLGMSYRRAWLLVDELNRGFVPPLVARGHGGGRGGGTGLTAAGAEVIALYRKIEATIHRSARASLQRLERLARPAAVIKAAPRSRASGQSRRS
jgi:molybdate transport system regulatory protein